MEINQKTVLIADDNKADSVRLSILLRRLDYAVVSVSSGMDVMKKMAALHPDIVLMKLWITGMDGLACLKHIKQDSRLKTVPVVFMSEKVDEPALADALKRGASAYLFKPLDPTPLYLTVQKLTETKPRDNLRARIIFRVTVLHENVKRISFATILSEKGVFIRTVKPLPIGAKVHLAMDLPSEKPIEIDGEIIYIVETNQEHFIEPGMCVKFTNIDKNTEIGLRKFVEEQLTYDINPNLDL